MRAFAKVPLFGKRMGVALLVNTLGRATTFLAFVVVGRRLGPDEAGVLSLATGYLAILTTFFIGLDDLVIREAVRSPKSAGRTLMSYASLRLPLTILGCVLVLWVAHITSSLTPQQFLWLSLIVISALFDAVFGVAQTVLFAFGGLRRLLWPSALTFGLRVGAGSLLLLQLGFGALALMWPLSSAISAGILLTSSVAVLRERGHLSGGPYVTSQTVRTLAALIPAFGAVSLLSALEYQTDTILLSRFTSTSEVAIYSSAASIMYMAALLAQAYRAVFYPQLVERVMAAPEAAFSLVKRAAGRMALLGLLVATVGAVIADTLMPLIFGSSFRAAGPVLEILIWNVIFLYVNVPLVRYLLATNRQKSVTLALASSTTVNFVANLYVIPLHGATGAAYVRLASSAVSTALIGVTVLRGSSAANRDSTLSPK